MMKVCDVNMQVKIVFQIFEEDLVVWTLTDCLRETRFSVKLKNTRVLIFPIKTGNRNKGSDIFFI